SQLELNRINLRHVNLDVTSQRPGHELSFQAENFDFQAEHIAADGDAALQCQGRFRLRHKNIAIRHCELTSSLTVPLDAQFRPRSGRLELLAAALQGHIGELPLADNTVALTGDLAAANNKFQLQELKLRQDFHGRTVAQLQLSANGTMTPLDFDYELRAPQLPPFLMEILESYCGGYQLGTGAVATTGHLSWSREQIAVAAKAAVTHRPRPGDSKSLPELALTLDQQVRFDRQQQQLDLGRLNAALQENGRTVLSLRLSSPFSWSLHGKGAERDDCPALQASFEHFPLPQLRLFLPQRHGRIVSGELNGGVKTVLERKTRTLRVKGLLSASGLAWQIAEKTWRYDRIELDFNTGLHELTRLSLPEFNFRVIAAEHPAVSLQLTGTADLKARTGTFQLRVADLTARTMPLLPPELPGRAVIDRLVDRLQPLELTVRTAGDFTLTPARLTLQQAQVALTRDGGGNLAVALSQPLPLDLRRVNELRQRPWPLRVRAEKFDLRFLNMFLPSTSSCRSGRLTAELHGKLTLEPQLLRADGALHLEQLAWQLGRLDLNGLELDTRLDTELSDNYRKIALKSMALILKKAGRPALRLENSGVIDLVRGAITAKTRIISSNEALAAVFLPHPPAAKFELGGQVTTILSDHYAKRTIEGDLRLERLQVPSCRRPLTARLQLAVKPEGRYCRLDRCRLVVNDGKHLLTDLAASGKVALPLSGGRSELLLASTHLDLLVLQELFAPTGKVAAGDDGTTAAAEPEPLPLNADAELRLDLDGISYGPEMKLSCRQSLLRLHDNTVTTDPLTVTVNGTPITIHGNTDLGRSGGYPFNYRVSFSRLDLAPLVHTFKTDLKQNISGYIDNFRAQLAGRGFSVPNLERYLNGEIAFDTAQLSFPNGMSDYYLVKCIFIPLDIFSRITQYVPSLNLSNDLSAIINSASQIGSNLSNLELERGRVDIKIADGRAQLRDFSFSGDFIRSFTAEGFVPLNGGRPMDVNTRLDVSYLIMPLRIGGTPDRPQPYIARMVSGIVTGNVGNLLKTTGNIIINGGVDGKNLLEAGGRILTDTIFGTDSSTKETGKKGTAK
ncbi:MAG: hypothetical protein PHQ27_05525, partial [Victivallales bacterium]|nr:hypothetical protein [Victivallales bacterium]